LQVIHIKIVSILKKLSKFLLIGIISFVILELVLPHWVKYNKLKIDLPTYNIQRITNYWADENVYFGTIHRPNTKYYQKKYCFDIEYQSNDLGFRDVSHKQSVISKRIAILGDSFIEGVGVDVGNRMSNILENKTKIQFMNFGMAGNFGTTQAWKCYENVVSKFKHEIILIGILPANDFIEDDFQLGLDGMANRYRPYLVGDYPNYKLQYYQTEIAMSKRKTYSNNYFKLFLKNFSNSYNLLAYYKSTRFYNSKIGFKSRDQIWGYFNYEQKNLDRIRFAFEKIKEKANGKRIYVFTIPTLPDIVDLKSGKENTLATDMANLCQDLQIEYFDLLNATKDLSVSDCKLHYLECDGHWSAEGHKFAAEVLNREFNLTEL